MGLNIQAFLNKNNTQIALCHWHHSQVEPLKLVLSLFYLAKGGEPEKFNCHKLVLTPSDLLEMKALIENGTLANYPGTHYATESDLQGTTRYLAEVVESGLSESDSTIAFVCDW